MAKFEAPHNFNFDKPTEWKHFMGFRTTTKMDQEDSDVQVPHT
jgi:hypothetical protein